MDPENISKAFQPPTSDDKVDDQELMKMLGRLSCFYLFLDDMKEKLKTGKKTFFEREDKRESLEAEAL